MAGSGIAYVYKKRIIVEITNEIDEEGELRSIVEVFSNVKNVNDVIAYLERAKHMIINYEDGGIDVYRTDL